MGPTSVNSTPGELIHQGAEARLYRAKLYSSSTDQKWPCIVKERFVKRYRHPELDSTLSLYRMRAEVRQLLHCREVGIEAPPVLLVDIPTRRIWLGEIGPDACTLHAWFNNLLSNDHVGEDGHNLSDGLDKITQLKSVTTLLGHLLAKLHANHIVHGDLTMCNILVKKVEKDRNSDSHNLRLIPIDFGLSSTVSGDASQRLIEDKAVDLYVFERALCCSMNHTALAELTTHTPELSEPCGLVDLTLLAYREHYAQAASKRKQSTADKQCKPGDLSTYQNEVNMILRRLEEVRLRGRKREMVS